MQQVIEHSFGPLWLCQLASFQLGEQIHHLHCGGTTQTKFFTAVRRNRGIATKHFGIQLGLRKAQVVHCLGGRRQSDRIDNQVRGCIIRVDNHQANRVAE